MTESLRRKDSEYRSGLTCPRCGRSLIPVPADTTVTFHCKSGHELSMLDLLSPQALALKGGLQALLAEWNLQRHALIETVEDAQKHGFFNIAEIFQRHAKNLESRIEVLHDAFSKADSTRLIRLPNSTTSD